MFLCMCADVPMSQHVSVLHDPHMLHVRGVYVLLCPVASSGGQGAACRADEGPHAWLVRGALGRSQETLLLWVVLLSWVLRAMRAPP